MYSTLLPLLLLSPNLLLAAVTNSSTSTTTMQTTNSSSSNTTPQTTLSSTTITSTGSVVIPGTSSIIANGTTSVVLAPRPTTIIIPNPTSPPVVAGEYKLRVSTTDGSHKFRGQYLAAWSTVANSSADAIFTTNKTQAARFYLNGTFEQADFGIAGQLWSMNMNYDLIDARWYTVSMKTPYSSGFGTFWLNGTGLQWTPNETPPPHTPGVFTELDTYFGGWFACDWWHGFPQLFYKVGFFNDTVTPSCCVELDLLQEYFK